MKLNKLLFILCPVGLQNIYSLTSASVDFTGIKSRCKMEEECVPLMKLSSTNTVDSSNNKAPNVNIIYSEIYVYWLSCRELVKKNDTTPSFGNVKLPHERITKTGNRLE